MNRDSQCQNLLHSHPLPSGYVAAAVMADERLASGWQNLKCPDCSLFGWRPPCPGSGRPPADVSGHPKQRGLCPCCRRWYAFSARGMRRHRGLPPRADGGCPYRCPSGCDFDCYFGTNPPENQEEGD